MHACKLHRLMNGQIVLYMTSDNINWSECSEYSASSWLNSVRSALQEGFDIEYEGPMSHLTNTALMLNI